MQLLLIALIAMLTGGKADTAGLLSALTTAPVGPESEKDIDAEIEEVVTRLAGGEIAEIMKMAQVIEGVTKSFSAPASKIIEADEVEAAAAVSTAENTGALALRPIANLADGDILHALSAALG